MSDIAPEPKRLRQLKEGKNPDAKIVYTYESSREGQLQGLKELRDLVLWEAKSLLAPEEFPEGAPITEGGLVALGLMERQTSYIDAAIVLHEKGMFRQISPLGRIVIDAVARYNGMFFAKDRTEYTRTLLHGGSLRVLKDGKGERMRDDHLQKILGRRCPYSRDMYARLNEEIHFGRTMTGRIMENDPVRVSPGEQTVTLRIGASTIPWGPEAQSRTDHFIMAVMAYRYTGPEKTDLKTDAKGSPAR